MSQTWYDNWFCHFYLFWSKNFIQSAVLTTVWTKTLFAYSVHFVYLQMCEKVIKLYRVLSYEDIVIYLFQYQWKEDNLKCQI